MKAFSLTKPHLIITVGIPGAGKSSFAEHFAETFKSPIISYDVIRAATHESDTQKVDMLAQYMLNELFKTERTVLIDGAFDSRADRITLAKRARTAGYEPLLVWVQTESIAAKSRALKPHGSAAGLSSEAFDARLKRFTAPNDSEKAIVISGKHTYASQLKIVLKKLVEPRAQAEIAAPLPTRPTPNGRSVLIR